MSPQKTPTEAERQARIVAELRRAAELRQQSYRERALKILPKICARCGREFSGKRLRELTVHHKDHNHDNNPPDGSNWELLCIYCHDDEHALAKDKLEYEGPAPDGAVKGPGVFKPFEGLDSLLKPKKD